MCKFLTSTSISSSYSVTGIKCDRWSVLFSCSPALPHGTTLGILSARWGRSVLQVSPAMSPDPLGPWLVCTVSTVPATSSSQLQDVWFSLLTSGCLSVTQGPVTGSHDILVICTSASLLFWTIFSRGVSGNKQRSLLFLDSTNLHSKTLFLHITPHIYFSLTASPIISVKLAEGTNPRNG